MGRASIKENKKIYQTVREELGYSREKAAEVLEVIPPERIEKIENERTLAHPEEILIMAEKYKAPYLCNYFCSSECPIGKTFIPEIKTKDLSKIVLGMLSSLNSMRKRQEQLIEIAADDKIDSSEIEDFVEIRENLDKISVSIEALRLWMEQMLATGQIDRKKYDEIRRKRQ